MKRAAIKTPVAGWPTFCLLFLSVFLVSGIVLGQSGIGNKKHALQVEIFGGFAFSRPGDLNRFAEYENDMQRFFYDRHLDALKNNGQIQSWSKTNTNDRNLIKNAWPLGFRVQYFISTNFAVSLGFKYMKKTASTDLEVTYSSVLSPSAQQEEIWKYLPFSISATVYVPLVGIQWRLPLMNRLDLDLVLSGGPMFAACRNGVTSSYDWNYIQLNQGVKYLYPLFSSAEIVEMSGTGTGIDLEAGGRVNYSLAGSLGIFLDAVYAYQKAGNISGTTRDTRNGVAAEWSGRWGMKKESIAAPWGKLEEDVPNNNWPTDKNWVKSREFSLDLSGFQFRLGFFFRL